MARILVIDDCAALLVILHRVLKEAGHEIRSATCSRRGAELIRRQRVDLVILDVYMPDPDGVEILRLAQQERLTIPFIMMSGCERPLRRFLAA